MKQILFIQSSESKRRAVSENCVFQNQTNGGKKLPVPYPIKNRYTLIRDQACWQGTAGHCFVLIFNCLYFIVTADSLFLF